MDSKDVKVIAFYLPQFYPTPENDLWWGKGFTEWTNVGKAKPLFKGHYQPKVPADLGYYDLRSPDIREQQVELAKEAGIYGFCYWHYWFGNGKRLLEKVFDEVLMTGKPDFPFCLAWANHSWYAKNWNASESKKDKLLIEQTYPGIDDAKLHFCYLLKAFHDPRYIKIGTKPLLVIFNPGKLPQLYNDYFQKWAIEAGFKDGIYLVGNITQTFEVKEDLLKNGYSAVIYQRLTGVIYEKKKILSKLLYRIVRNIRRFFLHIPEFAIDYKKALPYLLDEEVDSQLDVIPSIIPNWDHTPRSGIKGSLFLGSTPRLFKKHALKAIEMVSKKPINNRIIFLKSWNEWGEGNYMEPDLKFGKVYIQALREALDERSKNR